MKKKIFVISIVIIMAVVGVFALSSCTMNTEEYSPFRDTYQLKDAAGNPILDDKGKPKTEEGVVGYTFNPNASFDESKNPVFDSVETVVPVTEGGNYKTEKAFPVTHVGSVYDEELGKNVESVYPVIGISSNAFYGEKTLKRVVLPDCYYVVGTYAFFDCTSLKEIVLPAGLREIRQWAFYNCTGLEKIYFRGTEEQWNKLLTVKDNGKRDINNFGNTVIEQLTKDGKVEFNYTGN